MTKSDLQVVLEGVFEQLSARHVCDDDCHEGGCDRDTDDDWKEEIDADAALADCGITTFEADGYLTRDAGLTASLRNAAHCSNLHPCVESRADDRETECAELPGNDPLDRSTRLGPG